MKLLVTGAAGFIGSNFCLSQLRQGKKVVGIDNFDKYYSIKTKKNNLKQLKKYKNFVFCKTDIRKQKELKKLFEKHNIGFVVNLAAKPGVRASIGKEKEYFDTNLYGTLNLLQLSVKKGVKNFVQASTSSVYGKSKNLPYNEEDPANTPLAPYPASKKAAEMLCHSFHYNYGLPITILRFFTVYGPRGRPDMAVYKFTKNILDGKPIPVFGDGTSKRSYTYIDDIVKGIFLALKKNLGFQIINLGNNKTVLLSELIKTIERETGKKAIIQRKKWQKADMPVTIADIKKAEKLLGWRPETNLETGIKRFVEWYRSEKIA